MATRFPLTACHPEPAYARQALAAAAAELDALEARLSRYREGGDIFRLNRLPAGQTTLVHPDTYDCLRLALELAQDTGGAFDVAYASRPKGPGRDRFALEPGRPMVRVLGPGLHLDLGGIGKGFALDRLAGLLRDWDITDARLCASTSTILARGAPPDDTGWPVTFGPAPAVRKVKLRQQALSASGRGEQGDHIVDPRTGQPAVGHRRVWAAAPTAAVADALSTAFMIMPVAEVAEYCRRHLEISAFYQDAEAPRVIAVADRLTS